MDATIKQEKKSNDKLMPKIKLILKSVREYMVCGCFSFCDDSWSVDGMRYSVPYVNVY